MAVDVQRGAQAAGVVSGTYPFLTTIAGKRSFNSLPH
jgi:hypothetical protein